MNSRLIRNVIYKDIAFIKRLNGEITLTFDLSAYFLNLIRFVSLFEVVL